jgi:hypothetical protein
MGDIIIMNSLSEIGDLLLENRSQMESVVEQLRTIAAVTISEMVLLRFTLSFDLISRRILLHFCTPRHYVRIDLPSLSWS